MMASATPMETNVKQAVPFFMVTDMTASLQFYVDGLGCKMTRQWIDDGKLRWCWLEIGEAALMLQEYAQDGRHTVEIPPKGTVGRGVTISFQCLDALAIYQAVTGRGVKAQKPFVGNKMWVTALLDPDGYRLEFESPTDAPEESEFTG